MELGDRGMWLFLSVGLTCAMRAHPSMLAHGKGVLEIPEWLLGSVGSRSRRRKHGPLLAMLGHLSLDLSRNRQAAASKTTPGSGFSWPLCLMPCTALEGGRLQFHPASSEPSWAPCFPQVDIPSTLHLSVPGAIPAAVT